MIPLNAVWDIVTKSVRAWKKISTKPSNGIKNPQSRDMPALNAIWLIVMKPDGVRKKISLKLSNGTEKPQHKNIRGLSTTSAFVTLTDTA